MTNAIARRLYLDMGSAPARLAFLAIPTAIVWYIARHAIVWFGTALMWIAQQPAPKDADFALGETIIASLVAYLFASFIATIPVMMGLFESAGNFENVSPTLLALVTPPSVFAILFWPVWIGLFFALPVYTGYLLMATIGRLVGGRQRLAQWVAKQSADVIDIGRIRPRRTRST